MEPVVALVGRPNVGKSTLFNKIVSSRKAIVEDAPGITRDRIYESAQWLNHRFKMIDTGGIVYDEKENFFSGKIIEQVEIALEEADVIVFLVDGKAGMMPDDHLIAAMLRKSKKKVVLAVNKIEDEKHNIYLYDFYELGMGNPISISAEHGSGLGDLLDEVTAGFPDNIDGESDDDLIKLAVVGKPNAGKSSLVNYVLGQERTIVSDVPGTTRDAIDSFFTYDKQAYKIVDTAGMRRKARIDSTTEKYSILRTLRAVDDCDVALIVIDAEMGVTEQDKKVAGYAHEAGRGIIMVINKWDLIEKDSKTMNDFNKTIEEEFGFLQYAPVIYISALTGQRVFKIFEWIKMVVENQNLRIPTGKLNHLMEEITLINPPPTDKGRRLKILYVTQIGVKPPTFAIFVNDPELMHFSYLRYIENQFRENFSFLGTTIRFKIRKREKERTS